MSKLYGLVTLLLEAWIAGVTFFVPEQSTIQFDAIVAQDGTGNYTKIMDAVEAAPTYSARRYNIKIKQGNYMEYVVVPPDKANLTFVGDGIDRTIISGNRSFAEGDQTYNTATVGILGAGFLAMDITFENTDGAIGKQAVALRSDVQSAFYRCKFLGYQDTLCPLYDKQFYRECQIYGTVDFIFGGASVVFQNCDIYARLPPPHQSKVITITAQGRDGFSNPGGIVIHNCSILHTDDLMKSHSTIKVSLEGRGETTLERSSCKVILTISLILVVGWNGLVIWIPYFTLNTKIEGRELVLIIELSGKGFHILNTTEALNFTVKNFISGNEWIPSMGVPFFPDLM